MKLFRFYFRFRIKDTFDRFEIELPVQPIVGNGIKNEIKIEKLAEMLPSNSSVDGLKLNPFKKRKFMNDTKSKLNASTKKLKLDVPPNDGNFML